MSPLNPTGLNVRMSAIYAFGMWTLIGSYFILRFSRRDQDEPGKAAQVADGAERRTEVFQHGPHIQSVVVYKKDFVPYTTRIQNFIKSFGSEPGTGGSDK